MVAKGVQEQNIIFLNVVSCPEGIRRLNEEYPQGNGFKFLESLWIFTAAFMKFLFETIKVKIVTGQIDSHLNESKYIVPGLGDYGDRFFGSS